MTTNRKSTRTAGPAEKTEIVDTFIPLYTQNVERVAELQKNALDIVAEQSTELIEAWKKAFRAVPNTPALFWFDLFAQNVDRYVETQKGVIDLGVEQTHVLANLVQERGSSAAKMVEAVTSMFQQAVQHSVALQKKTLDHYSEQHRSAYDTAKKQFRMATPGAEAFQSGLDALFETQKAVLDIVSKPLRHSAVA